MQIDKEISNLPFDLPKNKSNVIKVIGIGGGGSNAINYMYSKGIKGVDFVVCNTDAQALENSPVENKIQLGIDLTEGLGAGANPEIGEKAANESFDDIKKMLETNTKMVFITAGMGGGTGTGAAPVISKFAKEMDILTVGIVTIPFHFEGKIRTDQANEGIEKLRKQVDALIVINNNKLRDIYGNLGFKEGFAKADEVLATASKGIAEVITHHYTQNIDLKDAKTVLHNSGNAIIGSARSFGSKRAIEAISAALDSPLLNDNSISGAKNVLLLIVSGSEEITIDEIGLINEHIQERAGNNANIIMGIGDDQSLDSSISVTVIATGFDANTQDEIIHSSSKKIVHNLDNENEIVQSFIDKKPPLEFDFSTTEMDSKELKDSRKLDKKIVDINVLDPELVKVEDQVSINFEKPLPNKTLNKDKIIYELTEDVNDIIVKDPIEIIPVSEVDGMDVKKSGFDSFEVKNKETHNHGDKKNTESKHHNSSIERELSQRIEIRKTKLKEFNYRFTNPRKFSKIEKEISLKNSNIQKDNIDYDDKLSNETVDKKDNKMDLYPNNPVH